MVASSEFPCTSKVLDQRPTVRRASSDREELYRQFYVHRNKMGDPTSMRSPEEVFGTGTQVIDLEP